MEERNFRKLLFLSTLDYFNLPGITQRQKLLINNLRTQRKIRLWLASGSFNPEDVEWNQALINFGRQILQNQNYFIQILHELNFTVQTDIKD